MRSTNKNILIINYGFPPFPGIGGRRWALFANELKTNGYNVYVIASENPFNHTSNWRVNDSVLSGFNQLGLKYPKSLILFPKSIFGKINYKISLLIVKALYNGNPYDRTIFWKKQLQHEVKNCILSHKITTVVVSAAPFSLLSYINNIIPHFNNINFIADIRDPWTTNVNAYGYSSLSKSRFLFEQTLEKNSLTNYNHIITVNNTISEYFKSLYSNKNVVTLINGFQESSNAQSITKYEMNPEFLNFVFTGSFYDNAIYLFEALINYVASLKSNTKIKFYFIGLNFDKLIKLVNQRKVNHFFEFGYVKSSSEVDTIISQSTYSMLFLTDDINYSFSTKFCEYLKHKKPILVFSKAGVTSNYVVKNNIGWHLDTNNISNVFNEVINAPKKQFPTAFEVNQFSLKNVTQHLIELINA